MSAELERLERRLYERLPERLEEERDPTRRALLYGFPQQFALLRDRLVAVRRGRPSRPRGSRRRARLRGVYFTSGTQEGSPDRSRDGRARARARPRAQAPARADGRAAGATSSRASCARSCSPRPASPESTSDGNAGASGSRRGAMGAAVAVLILATAGVVGQLRAQPRVPRATWRHSSGRSRSRWPPFAAGARSDLAALLPTLSSVRTLAETRATPDGSVPWSLALRALPGRHSSRRRAAPRTGACSRTPSFPSLATHLEPLPGPRHPPAGPDDAYDALKTYVMLYDPKHFNSEAVWRWYAGARRAAPARRPMPSTLKALKTHFDALYERGWVDADDCHGTTRSSRRCASVIGRDALAEAHLRTAEARADARPPRLHHRREGRPQGHAGVRARERRAADQGRARALHEGRLLQALRSRAST